MNPAAVAAANATFAAAVADQWIHCGLTHAFLAPGSRSTPLALALADRPELRIEVLHDERSAAFAALGHGLSTRRPAVVLCTSGTAATHFHAAVAEAGISCVPIIVCTANRPPELWGVAAPQTIDQTDLYRSSVRRFLRPGPPDELDPASFRPLANEAWAAATGGVPGPVQVDLSFREPLVGTVSDLPPAVDGPPAGSPILATDAQIDSLVQAVLGEDGRPRRGVVVAGRGESQPSDIADLARALGWPILADHRSGLRDGRSLDRFDTLLRADGDPHRATERILRFGEPLASKVLGQWIGALGRTDGFAVHSVAPWGRRIDPELVAATQTPEFGTARRVRDALEARQVRPLSTWRGRWEDADRSLRAQIDRAMTPAMEADVGARALGGLRPGQALVVSSSMPVRDVEWFGPPAPGVAVYSNRGANGIDGVIATAIGVAATGIPTLCLLGDVAAVHDQSSLTALARRSLDLTILVIDNDGGGIFSFLPQHEILDDARYEQLFGTPHGTDFAALAAAHHLRFEELCATTDLEPDGVRIVVAPTDRAVNHRFRQHLATLRPQ